MPTLPVELNADGVHSIRAPDRFTTTRPFSVELDNTGRSTHAHLHFDDALDRVASVEEVNHFVEDGAIRRIHVSTADVDESVRGKLKIVTGYGSNTAYVDVFVEPSDESADEPVVVDERFADPPETTPDPPRSQRVVVGLDAAISRGGLPALAVGFVAVGAGVAAAFAVESGLVFFVVALVLTVALGTAVLLVG